jgi:DNA-binding beta-propeller fold protein YncE
MRSTRVSLGVAAALVAVLSLAPAASAGTRFLYVAGAASTNVGGYSIDSSGALAAVTGSPFAAGAAPRGVAIAPNGHNLFVANSNDSTISPFTIAAATGVLGLAAPPPPTDLTPEGIAITPDGKFLYVADLGNDKVSGFALDGGLLTPAPGSPYAAAGGPIGLAITPDGTHLYSANFTAGTVSAFNIGVDGALAPVTGSPFADGGTNPFGITVTPDGAHLYTGHAASANVSGFNIGATGALTAATGSPFSVGTLPQSVNASPKGGFILATDRSANNIVTLAVGTDGALSTVGTPASTAGAEPRGGAFTPDGSRFYVASQTANNISGYSVAADGTLTSLGAATPSGLTSAATLGLAVTPNAGPLAAFNVTPAGSGQATTFNGGISSDPDGTIARYDWDFGDGATLADGGPTPSHTYANPGDYTAKLTVTDNEGCSATLLYTGQTVSCNGSSLATASNPVHVADATPPTLTLSGSKKQKLGKTVLVKASCDENCSATATGKLIVKPGKGKAKTRKFKLKKATAQVTAGGKAKLKLKVSKKARKAAKAALKSKGKVKAKLTVKAKDTAGNAAPVKKRTVKLKKG